MIYRPYDYQRYATGFIVEHPIAAVFLEMGLGKSVITLTAILELIRDRFEAAKVLVIAPLRVARDTWPSELEKWDHLKELTYSVAVGSEKKRLAALREKTDIHIINRENVDWLVNKSGLPFDYDTVVIDELSSFKCHKTNRFRSLMKVRPKVKRIVGLTGTPSGNSLMDLWAEFRLLDMGARLGRFITGYRDAYFDPDRRNQMIIFSYKPKRGAEEEIYRRISDITISMKAVDHLKMPDRITNVIPVGLSAKEREIYDVFRKEMVMKIGTGEIDAANAAVLANKLLQMANGAVYGEGKQVIRIHDRKLDALEDLIEAANGRPVMVVYHFRHDLERIKKRFAAREIKSSRDIEDWNARKIPLAAMHPASAGHGLNLQMGGSTLIWFGLTWSLEHYQQANARLWRQGQKETVIIHHIITSGTMDDEVMKALQRKEKTQADLINAVKASLEVA